MSQESSTGVKLLSAYKRAIAKVAFSDIQPPGLSTIEIQAPVMLVQPVAAGIYPVTPNLRYRFSGDLLSTSAKPTVIALESAGMVIILGTQANPNQFAGPTGYTRVNAARLSAQTALLEKSPISLDQWDVDCNDLLTAYPLAQTLKLLAILNMNDTGAAPWQVDITAHFQVAAAQFDGYRFDKWE